MRIDSVIRKYEESLMQLPDVNGIGIGGKNGIEVIEICVVHKSREFESALRKIIGTKMILEGFTVVIREIGEITAGTDLS
jgi:hypothetical protein